MRYEYKTFKDSETVAVKQITYNCKASGNSIKTPFFKFEVNKLKSLIEQDETDNSGVVIIYRGNKEIGFIVHRTVNSLVLVTGFYVHSKYRMKGYGRKLFKNFESMFDGECIGLEVMATEAEWAAKFYRKFGYTYAIRGLFSNNPDSLIVLNEIGFRTTKRKLVNNCH